MIQNHKFGFRNKYATINQVLKITDLINKVYEGKKLFCTFPRLRRNTRRVWSEIRRRILKLKQTKAGVHQVSGLDPVLYLLFTYDISEKIVTKLLLLLTYCSTSSRNKCGRSYSKVTPCHWWIQRIHQAVENKVKRVKISKHEL